MKQTTIKILVADEHCMVCESLQYLFDSHPRFSVIGATGNLEVAIQLATEQTPDIVLLEISAAGRGTFEAARYLMTACRSTRVVLLTSYLADVFLEQALRLEIQGYILKTASFEFLCNGLEAVMRDEQVFSPEVLERIVIDVESGKKSARFQSELLKLTRRQIEVLRYISHGCSVKEIARKMNLSMKSVDSHKYRIMNQLNIHDRVELARFAIREGLIMP